MIYVLCCNEVTLFYLLNLTFNDVHTITNVDNLLMYLFFHLLTSIYETSISYLFTLKRQCLLQSFFVDRLIFQSLTLIVRDIYRQIFMNWSVRPSVYLGLGVHVMILVR